MFELQQIERKSMEQVVHEAVAQAGSHGGDFAAVALVIAIAALAGLGFLWLRQPPLVGFILAGILLAQARPRA